MKKDLSSDLPDKCLAFLILAICIELVFFKFVPDFGTAVVQNTNPHETYLSSFPKFEGEYLAQYSVMAPRFLGTKILYNLALLISQFVHSGDIRLHPLRIAAGLLTPLYSLIGLYVVVFRRTPYYWKEFILYYSLTTLIGLYVFYPGDMPSFAFLSVGLFFLLKDRLWAAFLLMLITGLFRETSFHMVVFVALWSLSNRTVGPGRRLAWLAAFAIGFVIEYWAIRQVFPGPISMNENHSIELDPRTIFLGAGFASLTTICSLSLAAMFPIICLLRARRAASQDWRWRFFVLNCALFPFWVIFYRAMGGNISEFRLLFPVILPCLYGLSYQARTAEV